jgi:hypothetical protein
VRGKWGGVPEWEGGAGVTKAQRLKAGSTLQFVVCLKAYPDTKLGEMHLLLYGRRTGVSVPHGLVELRSTGQVGTPAPTWFVRGSLLWFFTYGASVFLERNL